MFLCVILLVAHAYSCAYHVLIAHAHAQAQWGCLLLTGEISRDSVSPLSSPAESTYLYFIDQILSHPPFLLRLCIKMYYVYLYGLPRSPRCIGLGEFADPNQVDLPCPVSVRVLGLDFMFVGSIHSPMSNLNSMSLGNSIFCLLTACSYLYICIYQ